MAKLFMLLIGCLPKNRFVEQHDVFFGIGESIREVLDQAIASWPEAGSSFHLDAWREVTNVDGYKVEVADQKAGPGAAQLFFINLGGYKEHEFEEFHYKMLVAAAHKNDALKMAKQTAFFRHTGFRGAPAHIDEKYGVDVDNIYSIKDILPQPNRDRYSILVSRSSGALKQDIIHLGYFRPGKVEEWGI